MEISLILVAVAAIAFALIQGMDIRRIKVEDPKVAEIGSYIADGAMAYLKRQYKILAVFVVVLAVILAVVPGLGVSTSMAPLMAAPDQGA